MSCGTMRCRTASSPSTATTAAISSTRTVDGETHQIALNQETVTVRGILPGEYVVNVYHYTHPSPDAVPVTVKVEKVNPRLSVIYYDTLLLTHKGDEQTVVRFRMDHEGNISDVNTMPVSLIQAVRK